MKKLLYVCEADSGGIMEYAIRQSGALAKQGAEVLFLCKPSFPMERLAEGIRVREFSNSRGTSGQRRVSKKQARGVFGKIGRAVKMIADLRSEARQVAELAEELANESPTRDPLLATRHNLGPAEVCILFACYKEYFAPFWAWPLRRLAKKGIVVGTIAHDPVRDFVVGPQWWHRWSVRLGYSFVRHIFVHDDTAVDFGGKQPEGIEVHQIPHGPYEVAEPKIGRVEMRRRLGFSLDLTTEDTESTEVEAGPCLDKPSCASESGSLASGLADSPVSESLNRSAIGPASAPATSHPLLATPASPAIIFLAFGQIRDGKNLDLFLRAMTCLPENVKLLVAGKGGSGSSKPPEYYQKLAEELGVGDRCRWDIRRIPDEEVGELFNAIDFTLLTYSGKFRSMSAVLATALTAKKPVLASSGAGPLKTVVEKYRLGVFVEPDDLEEVVRGAKILLDKIAKTAASEKLSFNKISLPADWNRYEMENSWDENAKVILHQMLSS